MIGSVSGGSENWISHSSGTLKLNSFTVRVTSRFSSSYTLVCVASSGTLTLNGMIFNSNASYSTYNTPLISVNAGYLTLSGTNSFTSIKRESGNGGVFEFTSTDADQTISNVAFTSCSSENGGAISATLSSGHKLSLSSLTFTSCTATSNGGALYIDGEDALSISTLSFSTVSFTSYTGNQVYVTASTLSLFTATASEWKNLLQITEESEYKEDLDGVYTGCYSSASPEISLQHLIFTPNEGRQTITYASPSGSVFETCGWSDIPCITLHDALTHASSAWLKEPSLLMNLPSLYPL